MPTMNALAFEKTLIRISSREIARCRQDAGAPRKSLLNYSIGKIHEAFLALLPKGMKSVLVM